MRGAVVEIGGVPLRNRLANGVMRLEDGYAPFSNSLSPPIGEWLVRSETIPSEYKDFPRKTSPPQRWEIATYGPKRLFRLWHSPREDRLWKVALMEPRCAHGDIWIDDPSAARAPLSFLDLLLWSCLLLYHGGMIVHAAAIKQEDGVYLFPGIAGSGKSTWAELISARARFVVLGDDKVVVRRRETGWEVYGTPWNSRPGYAVAQSGPLKSILFLEPDKRNVSTGLPPSEIIHHLLASSFLPFSAGEDYSLALSLIGDLVDTVPACRFGFMPDETAVEYFEDVALEQFNHEVHEGREGKLND